LTRDKGIVELVEAYSRLRECFPELRLLLVGDVEEGDPLPPDVRRHIDSAPEIIHTGLVQDPVPYYHVMDVLAFPTHREGFGNAALEAQASAKPVVAARATGVVDSVIDGVTGILVPIGDSRALAEALHLVLENKSLAAVLGAAGRDRVQREFRQERIWDAIVQEYLQLMKCKGFSLPGSANSEAFTTELPGGPVVFR
jgi:glycosyltransferase involved in cell wall biosynthesis